MVQPQMRSPVFNPVPRNKGAAATPGKGLLTVMNEVRGSKLYCSCVRRDSADVMGADNLLVEASHMTKPTSIMDVEEATPSEKAYGREECV